LVGWFGWLGLSLSIAWLNNLFVGQLLLRPCLSSSQIYCGCDLFSFKPMLSSAALNKKGSRSISGLAKQLYTRPDHQIKDQSLV
jgi:hypothetical protein